MPVIDLIIIFASGLSVVMALGLLVRPLYFRNVVLSVILALMGFLTFSLYLLYSQKMYDYPILFFFLVPVDLMLGPFLYFYVLSLTGDKGSLTRNDILHFIPLLIAGLYMLSYFLYTPNMQREVLYELMNQNKYMMLRVVFSASVFMPVFYIVAPLIRMIMKLKKGNLTEKNIIFLFSVLCIWLIAGIVGIGGTITLSYPVLKMLNLFISLVILCFYLLSQRYPYLLQYGTLNVGAQINSKSLLNGLDLENLKNQLIMIMEQEKIYCDEDLSLPRLSQALDVTPHQLSHFLNKHYNKNFNNFVNSYRIEEAKKLLIEEPERNTLSIALAVGFNSYSAFHAAFRKTANQSPAGFRKNQLK
jgi:AraC-like DNA-binding protein